MSMGKQRRVLVIRGGAVGDFILTLPAIELLRENIAGVHLEVLGYAPIIELAKAGGLAEQTRSLEHASMAKLFVPNATIDPALVEYLCGFNLVVSYLYDPDGYFRGNLERIGVKTLLEVPHRVEAGKGHAAEQLAKPLEKLAMFLDNPASRLKIECGEMLEGDVLAVHPGSGSLLKNWPVDRWISSGAALMKSFPQLKLALITGEAERERGITEKVLEGWKGLRVEHWDQLPLPELASRLSGCRGFMGHDSGISHLAAACGVPCLLFFGPTDPAIWAPRNSGVEVFVEAGGNLAGLSLSQGLALMEDFATRLVNKK
ncbi:glycosyltransferase family 9 protein [Phragmitibacter flavus]|uniref:Glycosyltransferase family 9 protein n=1 Tax=Phragmitibacter flavus TaxID=2576071 RepID=A0A5R8KK68_9BACT|nr:glycosyltransferase family 9 protein [Phragmitibacter flavus]TLD72714.1 glycosyltransferase family 9 protein [Phragmitibacter flavus]